MKGWAVEHAAKRLAAVDGYGWFLNAGGDVVAHAPAAQPPWRIGIEDPADPSRVVQVVACRDGAVATSGTARRGAHIIDPFTRRPVTAVLSATVVGPHLMRADMYATATVARGPSALEWLDDLDGYKTFLVTHSDHARTAGWPGT